MDGEMHVEVDEFRLGVGAEPFIIVGTFFLFYLLTIHFITGGPDRSEVIIAWLCGAITVGIIIIYGWANVGRTMFRFDDWGVWINRRGERVLIDFTPDVEAEVSWDPCDNSLNGLRGFSFAVEDKEVDVSVPEFSRREIRKVWPAFVWVVRRYDLRRGPELEAMMRRFEETHGRAGS